jgi:hypothetical protein
LCRPMAPPLPLQGTEISVRRRFLGSSGQMLLTQQQTNGVSIAKAQCKAGRLDADLHVVILIAAIALFGNRHDRGVNHLAAARNVALRLQMLAKALEQLLNQTGSSYRRILVTEEVRRQRFELAI